MATYQVAHVLVVFDQQDAGLHRFSSGTVGGLRARFDEVSNAEQILSSFSGFCRFQSYVVCSCQEMKTIVLQVMLAFLLLLPIPDLFRKSFASSNQLS